MHADCHIHMVLDGAYWRAAIGRHEKGVDRDWVRQMLARYRAAGITFLRDGGDRWGVGAYAAQIAEEYGIRYRTPTFPIHKNGHYGGFIGRGFDTPREFDALVREAKAQGAHFIKIMISGLMDFDRYGVLTDTPLSREEIAGMTAAAHDAGFAVMAHANGDAAVSAAIAAGVDSVEHGAYLSEETLRLLAQSKTVWTPTLVTIGNLIGEGRFPDAVLRPLLTLQTENVKKAAALGALIAAGSDAGAYCVGHAEGARDEYALLSRALGETAQSVLSRGNAEIMRRF